MNQMRRTTKKGDRQQGKQVVRRALLGGSCGKHLWAHLHHHQELRSLPQRHPKEASLPVVSSWRACTMLPEPASNYFMTTRALLSQWITYVKAALSIDWNKRKSFDSPLFPRCHACLISPSFVWRKGGQEGISFQGEIRRGSDPFIMKLCLLALTAEVREILSTPPCRTVTESNSRNDRGTGSWKRAVS